MPVASKTVLTAGLALVASTSSLWAQQDAAQGEPTAGWDTVLVLEFVAPEVRVAGDVVPDLLEMGREKQLSRLEVPDLGAEISRVEGALMFQEFEAFSLWRKDKMESFFQPVGGVNDLDMSLRIFRPELLAQSNVPGMDPIGDVAVSYRNTGNDSAGDADIDAVTVICPGDQADCKPSN
ncbi:hypothetical protein O4G76_07105 [Limimaricola sp. G21655-S1]|uniref:hypothetical protein n=1 Tax=Limimaricola sp. G21655-S1 TaxID=3014768 RepID=UPI0022AF0257|nr:hypothetical protein [Limimaricola sp. G21655-S1]MCZ4260608.1 hypothetical protein [Limimaricola sp. G21655-S1]